MSLFLLCKAPRMGFLKISSPGTKTHAFWREAGVGGGVSFGLFGFLWVEDKHLGDG